MQIIGIGGDAGFQRGNGEGVGLGSRKGEGVGEGICLTYVAAGLVETVSYDFTDDGWVYNSTDTWVKE